MKKLYTLLLLILVVSIGAHAADPRDTPVTLAVKGEALVDIVPMLTEQTGVKLTVSKDIADQKATIFVDKRPLKQLMADLETVFGYQWYVRERSDGAKAYELDETGKAKRAREAALNRAKAKAFDELDAHVRQIVQWADEKKPEELDAIVKQLRNKKDRTAEETAQCSAAGSASGYGRYFARMYLTFTPEIMDALRDECTICYDTNTTEARWLIPDTILSGLKAEMHGFDWTPIGYNLSLRDETFHGGSFLQAQVDAYCKQDDGTYKQCAYMASIGPRDPLQERPDSPGEEFRLPKNGDVSALDRQVAFTAKELDDEANLWGQTLASSPLYVNRSDILALLHRKTGLQVVSDHHSMWFAAKPEDKQSVKYIIEHTGRDEEPKSKPGWGWNAGCLYMRERFPYALDASEIPNRLTRQWRKSLAENHCFGLDDAAGLFSLRREQGERMTNQWQEWLFKAKGVDYSSAYQYTDHRSSSIFRFYGFLTDLQKRRILSNGLKVAELSQAQLNELMGALETMSERPQGGMAFTPRVGVYKHGFRMDRPQTTRGLS